jgi:hypothetical protein
LLFLCRQFKPNSSAAGLLTLPLLRRIHFVVVDIVFEAAAEEYSLF